MKIVAPIKNLEETKATLEAGADELYCGILTQEWLDNFSNIVPINKRGIHANISSFADLKEITSLVKKAGKKIALTLNFPFYSEKQIPFVKHHIKSAIETGIDAFIISDLWLLDYIKIEKHISAIAGILNSEAIKFYKEYASRVILSRDFTIKEIEEIEKEGIEVEAFALNDGCKNVDGLCTFFHGIHGWDEKYFGCMLEYKCKSKNMIEAKKFERRLNKSSHFSCNCAACAIPRLKESGISHLKISGRQLTIEKKEKDIKFLKLLIQNLNISNYEEFAKQKYKEQYNRSCKPSDCYY